MIKEARKMDKHIVIMLPLYYYYYKLKNKLFDVKKKQILIHIIQILSIHYPVLCTLYIY